MFGDDEIDEVFLEFRRLTRKLDGSSTPIIRDIIRSIKQATNEIRRSHWRAGVEDGPEDKVAEDANGGSLGVRQSRDDNSLLRPGVSSMGMTAPGNMSANHDFTPEDPVGDDRHHGIGESHATDKEDNRVQQNPDIPSMHVQERGSDQEPGGRVNIDYEPGPVDAETLGNEHTNQFSGKDEATSTGLHCEGADTEHNRTQQNPPSRRGQDQTQDQTQEQAQEQKLRISSRKRKSPAENDGYGSENDPEIRPARQAALRARKSFSGQSALHTPDKRRKHSKDASKEVDVLPQLESQLGNEATLTVLREAKHNWTLISQTDLAMDDQPEDSASDGLSFMISLGRRLSTTPAEAWTSRIFHRIRCAHFHQLYMVAIEEAQKGEESSFFCLSDELLRRHGENPTRRHGKGHRASSAVKDRLVELILLDPKQRLQLSKDRCRQVIQDVEQNGKRWSRLIQRLGYETLLLIPTEFSDRKMKLLTGRQMDWLMGAWKTSFTRLKEADHEEVKRTLDVLFMPCIRPYLEIYNAGGGFSSLPSFGERGPNASVQGTPHTETQEPILDKLGIARSPSLFATSEGPSGNDNTSSPRDEARSSEWLESLPTTPLQCLLVCLQSMSPGQEMVCWKIQIWGFPMGR